ncbi:threonine synthase [Salipiger marinus]|uniref:threonine synthase n=1 Tax=Salipiger marinus TaxID=555512 RepID=UPI0040582844
MTEDHLICITCGSSEDIAKVPSTCPACGGILDLVLGSDAPSRVAGPGVWAWASRLPAVRPQNRITLGEGATPVLQASRLARQKGLSDLWIKTDSLMPTGSFKDRAIAVATALACEYDRPGMVLSSSGNAGASGAAYAARAGRPIVILVPRTAPPAKLRQIAITGARLVTVDGPTSECCRLAEELSRERGWVNLTTTFHNPFGVDGYATIAYELAPLKPDVLLLPISSGPLLVGLMKGFEHLHAIGAIDRVPRPVAVQPTACAPIARAFDAGGDVGPWAHQPTIASALNDTLEGYENNGDYTLAKIRRHGGAAIAIGEAQILDSQRELASAEGILLEPSAAITIGAIAPLLAAGLITPDERVVAVGTGHGLKDLSAVSLDTASGATSPQDLLREI